MHILPGKNTVYRNLCTLVGLSVYTLFITQPHLFLHIKPAGYKPDLTLTCNSFQFYIKVLA